MTEDKRKPHYRVIKTGETVFRYAAQQSYGGSYSHVEFAITAWGAKKAIKRDKKRRFETVVYETD